MKGPRITLSDIEKSACGPLNKAIIQQCRKAPKQPKGDCPPVKWMECQLAAWTLATGIFVTKEYLFHPTRKWRFDFALVDQKIAIEYEGIMAGKSRHTTISGYTGDTEKYNAAAELGWTVLRFTVKNCRETIKSLESTLNNR